MSRISFALRSFPGPSETPARDAIAENPPFGKFFSDHMISADWSSTHGWHSGELHPYRPLAVEPASAVIHYAQTVFEGLKAYKQPDGGIALFRPERNAARLTRSARRLALPEFPEDAFVEACELLVSQDRDWVPSGDGSSLYLRPFIWGTGIGLGVRPSETASFHVIASPTGSYFSGPLRPISLWLSQEYTRAAPGGTGAAKCSGNYAASLVAQQEAVANGCDQVMFLDAAEHRWLEELGGMNIFLVMDDGRLVTPEISGTILEGITRDSVITIARDLGYYVEERKVDVDEWRKGAADGSVVEVFACGTAAVITPVGALRWPGDEAVAGSGEPGETTMRLRKALMDIQYGLAEDPHGWRHCVIGRTDVAPQHPALKG